MNSILPYTDEHRMFRAGFSKFVEKEIVPFYAQWEKDRIIPRQLYQKMAEYGYYNPDGDPEYGGDGGDFLYWQIIFEELGRKGFLSVHTIVTAAIMIPYFDAFGTKEQKERWLSDLNAAKRLCGLCLTEPGAGSDVQGIITRAIKDGDDWVINGSKMFISNAINADMFVVAARTKFDGKPSEGMSLFVVEKGTPGMEIGPQIEKIGQHAQDTCPVYFDNCRVPSFNLLGKENHGFVQMMHRLGRERLSIALLAVANSEGALELTVNYTNERKVFGKPLASFQNTQFVLAELATRIAVGRAFVEKCILLEMAGENVDVAAAMAKNYTCELQNRVMYECLQLFGGYGYCAEYEISRRFVDARIQNIYGGTSEVMKMITAKALYSGQL